MINQAFLLIVLLLLVVASLKSTTFSLISCTPGWTLGSFDLTVGDGLVAEGGMILKGLFPPSRPEVGDLGG